jgi:tRNA (cytidine/uridine-2'-O-)-methyltransferase
MTTPELSKNEGNTLERHIVLVSPEIHWNTGNIGRTCVAAGAHLHLIKPLGFSLDSKHLKRAGLDYWNQVKLTVWDDFGCLQSSLAPQPQEIALFSKTGIHPYRSLPSARRLILVFGSETQGLPENIRRQYPEATYHIPITRDIRSLNLSTAVGIALYESLRMAPPFHGWNSQ